MSKIHKKCQKKKKLKTEKILSVIKEEKYNKEYNKITEKRKAYNFLWKSKITFLEGILTLTAIASLIYFTKKFIKIFLLFLANIFTKIGDFIIYIFKILMYNDGLIFFITLGLESYFGLNLFFSYRCNKEYWLSHYIYLFWMELLLFIVAFILPVSFYCIHKFSGISIGSQIFCYFWIFFIFISVLSIFLMKD